MALGDGAATLVCLSDTHGLHRTIKTEQLLERLRDERRDLDQLVVLHSGDFNQWPTAAATEDFNKWMAEDPLLRLVPKQRKIVIQGNHDIISKVTAVVKRENMNFTLLLNESCTVTVGGREITVLGCMFNENGVFSWEQVLGKCPDCDILLTHSPCNGDRLEDKALHHALRGLTKPKHLQWRVHVSGHAHERHYVSRDDAHNFIWVGAALHQGHNKPLVDPVLLPCPAFTV
eukprot:TRINITY_DN4582_c0_g1_i3.p1 TRINITY_DN4582_c0_g1~~TRINITY_DN4582_c0_g1_i3.p1  ORF type:complete len:244 (+),score=69.39 TRINITY_DN4582_c0_g1_i3:41-733(+)